jgi:hypothetical protein
VAVHAGRSGLRLRLAHPRPLRGNVNLADRR